MSRDLGAKQPDETLIHEFVLVRDLQTNHSRILQIGFEAFLKLVAVTLLHHENEVRPTDELRRERIFSVIVRPCGRHIEAWMAGEHVLGCRTSQAILATYKEHILHPNMLPMCPNLRKQGDRLSQSSSSYAGSVRNSVKSFETTMSRKRSEASAMFGTS